MSEKLKELRSLDMAHDRAKNAHELTKDSIPLLQDQAYRALMGLQVSFQEGVEALKDSMETVVSLRVKIDAKTAQVNELEEAQNKARTVLAEYLEANKGEENERFKQTLNQIKRKLEG